MNPVTLRTKWWPFQTRGMISATINQTVLIVKHLPAECTEEECRQLLTSLGASSITFMGHSGPLKHCAFAEFASEDHAWKIIKGLHQKSLFGKRISVEFASDDSRSTFLQTESPKNSKDAEYKPSHKSQSSLSGFAPSWDRLFDIPSKLVYHYPAPTEKILTNIVRTLVSCSAFYTQVLHLMNRMHLPPPFDDPDLFPGTYLVVSDKDVIKNDTVLNGSGLQHVGNSTEENLDAQEMDLSSGPESELDSDDTERIQTRRIIPKRKRIRSNLPTIRPLSAFRTGPKKLSSDSKRATAINEFFEPTSKPRRLNLQLSNAMKLVDHPHEIDDVQSTEGGFGMIESSVESLNKENTLQLLKNFETHKNSVKMSKSLPISDQQSLDAAPNNSPIPIDQNTNVDTITTFSLNELRQGCLTPEDRSSFTVFSRGYDPGEPTSRLYIKNLASLVRETDLFQVYGLFANGPVVDPNEKSQIKPESSLQFSIRLLTEGRMKGQAFISLPCESTARQALEVTNGFMLFDKPMVVQFARGAKAKVDEKSLILSQPES